MNSMVKEIFDYASAVNMAKTADEVLELKPQFDEKISKFINRTGDGLTALYTFEYTTLTQQRIIDDAVIKIARSLVEKGYIDEQTLGDFFPEGE